MRMQFPCVPRNDIRTLIQHALETVAYRLLNKSFKKRHASEARTWNHRDDTYDSLSQENDLTEALDGLETYNDQEPLSESDFSDFFFLEDDSNLADPESYIQSEARWEVKRRRTSFVSDDESFEPLFMK